MASKTTTIAGVFDEADLVEHVTVEQQILRTMQRGKWYTTAALANLTNRDIPSVKQALARSKRFTSRLASVEGRPRLLYRLA